MSDDPSDGAGTAPPISLPSRALEIRNATLEDIPGVNAIVAKTYRTQKPYTVAQLRGQQTAFPEGQLVVVYDGEIVGFAATFIAPEAAVMKPHTWQSITAGGYGAMHDPDGDWLYGMEVCVDPDRRRLRIGQRLYEARKALAQELGLKGVAFGGRIPGFARRAKRYPTPEAYLTAVLAKEIKDPVLGFQMRAGFEPTKVLRGYDPDDRESGGHAVLSLWRNPHFTAKAEEVQSFRRDPQIVRVTTVQLQARPVSNREEFYRSVANFVDAASDYQSDFVVFPELFTLQMLAAEHRKLPPDESIDVLSTYTAEFVERFNRMAISYNINIIGGSHPTRTEDGDIQNVSYVFLRDGSVHAREKLHPTPDERYWWNIQGGDALETIDTDCGPIGVLICYDSEFPELARRLVDQGALIVFVPYCTDTRQGHLRVRYCCQARAIENQIYVVTSGNVGNLPDVENMDLQYAQSGIFTPCDYPFARDGIAAEASENVEMVAVADLDLSTLRWARRHGSVRNLRDRRFDLYRTVWTDAPKNGA